MTKGEFKLLQEIADTIFHFLVSKGGMRNGYRTYAEGRVSYNVFGTLKVRVNNDDLTLRELSKIADELEDKLHVILKKSNFKEDVVIKARQDEHGAYETSVSIPKSVTVFPNSFK